MMLFDPIERDSPSAAHCTESDYQNALTIPFPRRVLFVIENTSESSTHVAGFLAARRNHSAEWEIENIVVADSSRRRGLASLLLKSFFSELREAGKTSTDRTEIHLEVRESNLGARRLYEKFGFTLDTRRKAYYRHPEEDAILYRYTFQ